MTFETKKCFSFFSGRTAVHFVSNNFFGLMGFFCLEGVTAIFLMVHLKGSAYWDKEDGTILDVCGATLIKIAFFTQAAAVTEILF